jgi:tetratricopeptide (TPR) repeat protein
VGTVRRQRRAVRRAAGFSWETSLASSKCVIARPDPQTEWYSKAVAVNPNHWKAQFNLGWLCLNLKQYDQALAAFRHAVKLNRFDAPGHANLGRTLFELGEDQEALQELEVAIQLDPKIREYPGFPNDKLAGRNGVSGARGRNGGKNATF